MSWPANAPVSYRNWLRSKKRATEGLHQAALRLTVSIAYAETVGKGMTHDAMAEWLDLDGAKNTNRTRVSRLIENYGLGKEEV